MFVGPGFAFVGNLSLETLIVVSCVLHVLGPSVGKQNFVLALGNFAVRLRVVAVVVVAVVVVHLPEVVERLALLFFLRVVIAGLRMRVGRLICRLRCMIGLTWWFVCTLHVKMFSTYEDCKAANQNNLGKHGGEWLGRGPEQVSH